MKSFFLAHISFLSRCMRKSGSILSLLLCSASIICAVQYKRIVFDTQNDTCSAVFSSYAVPTVLAGENQQEKETVAIYKNVFPFTEIRILQLCSLCSWCKVCIRQRQGLPKNQHKFIQCTIDRQTVK